jgi:hypothetical protein
MKALQLTEEHKVKLLEMCNKLFPEYKDLNYYKDYIGIGWSKQIHWFEFCMTWLSHKIIFNSNNKLSACNHNHASLLESTMSIFYGEKHGIHPVDYLYEEFLKIK